MGAAGCTNLDALHRLHHQVLALPTSLSVEDECEGARGLVRRVPVARELAQHVRLALGQQGA